MSKHRTNDIHPSEIEKRNTIPTKNMQQSPSTTLVISDSQKAVPDRYHQSTTIWRVIIDIISLAILLIVTVISHYVAIPFTRGYFCSDTSIKYPYKDNTVPTYAAVILSIGVPLIWMWTTEFCKRCYFSRYPKEVFVTGLELSGTKIINISPFVRNLYILTVVFAYGYLSTWVLLEVTKNFIGELRPHFLAVCQPSYDCGSATLNTYHSYLLFGDNYTCTNTDSTAVREARRSFFSGHTAPLFYGFGFLIMYIHVSWSWRHLGILGHLFQTGLTVLACYVGYTRISDFHHHWHDVLVGSIVGSLIAFVTFKFILNWRHYDPKFLPYTVSTRTKSSATQNGGASIINTRRNGFTVAESDSETTLGLEQTSLFRQRTSPTGPKSKMNTSPLREEKYRANPVENKWQTTSTGDARSRAPILQPVSLLKIVFDGLSLLIVLLTWLFFKYLVKPVRRAFLCSDLSLYHPPPEKKVFPTWLLFVCAIIIPLIIIILSEGVRWYYLIRKKVANVVYKIQFRARIYDIPEWIGNLYIIVGVFIFANCANSFLTNVGKVAVGRLRPHFIPSCFGKYSYKDFCIDPNDWIVNYTCMGESSDAVKEKDGAYDIRQSFPSGHASSAFCGLIFLALYIHKVWNYRNIGLFPYVMEMLCFALAAYIGITRITDNRHHATDVLGGAILGTFVAIIAFRYMVRSFKRSILLKSWQWNIDRLNDN